LAGGDAPACVAACPNEAIRIRVVAHDAVIADNEAGQFLPAAPDPSITQPTTAYTSARAIPRNALPADYYDVHAEAAHAPLVVMLVLTQLAVGTFALAPFAASGAGAMVAVALGFVALGASLFHLGRPHLAFRAVLGLRRSWLSREIVAFGGFAALASLAALAPDRALVAAASAAGALGVVASTMVYAATRRATWRADVVGLKFLGTTIVLGLATLDAIGAHASWLPRALAIALGVKLAFEASLLAHARDRHHGPWKRSAQLQLGRLRALTCARFATGAGAIAFALCGVPEAAVALALAGELCERALFFVAACAPRMPGALA